MTDSSAAGDARTLQLRERLDAVRQRIARAAAAAGREENPPRLIVVSKFHPAADVRRLAVLGVRDFGENRDQEASAKAEELEALDLAWHFVGQLQSKKSKTVVRYATAVHSVDRSQLVTALHRAMAAQQELNGRADLDCFIQVGLDDDAGGHRGGAAPEEVPQLAEQLEAANGLRLAGVMAVAPLGADPDRAFEKLLDISTGLQRDFPGATGISAGMSQDLESAVRFGATHLRIGSDILGSRPAVR
ncbi:YggS family pyridoxal phosphate-dependent enzyme [Arthrobacter sp. NPDC057013]|uniref:YggS family pyridoxal phosphate-dependent enzyme n=1 Tax=Arthrobacter sp. NPDC057013 TaxID=3345999 RepID=UPI0036441ECE